jgi:hypothetical protein
MATLNAHVVKTAGPDTQATLDLYVDNPEDLGGGGDDYVLPAATTSALGGVKQAATVASVSAADATSTASTETVDPTEFAAVVTLLNECKAKLNAVIANDKTAGQMA